jgi:hypothetical protein
MKLPARSVCSVQPMAHDNEDGHSFHRMPVTATARGYYRASLFG